MKYLNDGTTSMDIKLTPESRCPMGRYAGTKMKDVPAEYLLYMYESDSLGKQMRRYVAENIAELKQKAQ